MSHAIAVIDEQSESGNDNHTLVFLSAIPLDPQKVAAAFDALHAVREQDPKGGYIRLCIDADGGDCGLFFSPEGFNSGGYGKFILEHNDARRIAGRFVLAQPEDFMGQAYQFDLHFDAAITPLPGSALPPGGGEAGKAYNAYLAALAQGDFAALRTMAGEDGAWRYPEDDPTAAKEALSRPVTASRCRRRSCAAGCMVARPCCGCVAWTAMTFPARGACGWRIPGRDGDLKRPSSIPSSNSPSRLPRSNRIQRPDPRSGRSPYACMPQNRH
ncbi:hypothetical protein ACFPOA_13625 [Lysobacter niabensis]|uniref:hypothetical protein n=1 Tax=Agrilutibacter niabensis TaxID=380628 RepID=UPI00361962E6